MGRKKTENRITDESLFISTRAVDRRGTRYGKLVCIEPTEKRQSGSAVWRCKCDCGNEAFVSSKSLVTGKISSCGCIKREMMRARATDHTGMRYGKLVAIEPLENRQEAVLLGVAAVTVVMKYLYVGISLLLVTANLVANVCHVRNPVQ